MHARMSWPAVSKELLVAKYAKVAPRCRTAWPLYWPQTALRQQRSSCSLCKTECTPEVPHLTGVNEPFLVPMSDSSPISKHPIIVYVR